MNKIKLLMIVNLFLFLSMLAQIMTGLVLFFGLFAAKAKLFEAITEIHEYNGLILAVLVILHVALNWGWIKSQFFKRNAA
ncbi:MAG: DUF4405 domain-containing protein [Candidatus Omnitrophica bacterium]|nr:DUF4405 domain-containing protein [Candidatus Omnitrophota bacterium]MDD5436828.1 DUF4405 domain-containing protein [Candidatus Omnitrophota bacterium]